jgi:hypothetical protein
MVKEKRIGYHKAAVSNGPEKANEAVELPVRAGTDDSCRCKEASKMTPGELLKLMIGDLTFWKKKNKE